MRKLLAGIGCGICAVGAVVADEARLAFEESEHNVFLTPFSILEDRPYCDLPGQTPLKVEVTAPAVTYSIFDPQRAQRGTVTFDDTFSVELNECFRTERRGTERMVIATACSPETTESELIGLRELKIECAVGYRGVYDPNRLQFVGR